LLNSTAVVIEIEMLVSCVFSCLLCAAETVK